MKESPRENSNYLKPYTLKPTPIPDGFILKIDTREQHSLFDKPPKGLMIVRDTLKYGDYSIKSMEDIFCVERKVGDIYSYVSAEREKTVRKMKEFSRMKFVGLVIEESRETNLYQF